MDQELPTAFHFFFLPEPSTGGRCPLTFAAGKDGPAPEWQPVRVQFAKFAAMSSKGLILFCATTAEEQAENEKHAGYYFEFKPTKLMFQNGCCVSFYFLLSVQGRISFIRLVVVLQVVPVPHA